ncbi:MAG: Ser-tRNA(Ala) deacylase @ Gly-tRNA(Ala) deacylase, partial [uncultured Acetobacteraceae bacterium]
GAARRDGAAVPGGRLRARVRRARAVGRAGGRVARPHRVLRPGGRAAGRHRRAGMERRRHGRGARGERAGRRRVAPPRGRRDHPAGRRRGGGAARMGAAAPAHADAHRAAPALQPDPRRWRHRRADRRRAVAARLRPRRPARQGLADRAAQRPGCRRPPRRRALDHRGGAGRRTRLGADAVRAAAARGWARPLGPRRAGGCARGPPALRRHACALHRRDRPGGGDEVGEQGQAEPARLRRAGGGGV